MAKRLGCGEYERADVEIKQSDIEARYLFLKALKAKRSFWVQDLLGLFKYDESLKEFLENDKVDSTIHFFLSYLLSRNPHKKEIIPELINTPLINYYWFFLDKENEIKQLENDEDTQSLVESNDSVKCKSHILKKLIPSWKELKNQPSATALCASLENWAKEYNLNEDWFLDFALNILRFFKSEFDFQLANFAWINTSLNEARLHRTIYESEVRDSISTAISEFRREEVWKNEWLGFDDLDTLPAFEYRWRNFALPPLTWLIRMCSRKGFVVEMQDKLNEKVEHIRYSHQLYSYSNDEQLNHLIENKRKYLESYCDYIEKQQSENIDESIFPPANFEAIEKFFWLPSKQTREKFVEATLLEIKTQIEENHEAHKSYETFTKRHFKAEITKYCNDLEKSLPKDWVKTPVKYSEEKHFEWVVEFQITPYKSYTQIAKENNVHLTTIKENVEKLAPKIGILLRKAEHTGKPIGTKDSNTSLRKLNIFKN